VALSHEPSLDLTVKSEADAWATRLHGEVLSNRFRPNPAAGLGDHAARIR
jgi:hypothetical protein